MAPELILWKVSQIMSFLCNLVIASPLIQNKIQCSSCSQWAQLWPAYLLCAWPPLLALSSFLLSSHQLFALVGTCWACPCLRVFALNRFFHLDCSSFQYSHGLFFYFLEVSAPIFLISGVCPRLSYLKPLIHTDPHYSVFTWLCFLNCSYYHLSLCYFLIVCPLQLLHPQ